MHSNLRYRQILYAIFVFLFIASPAAVADDYYDDPFEQILAPIEKTVTCYPGIIGRPDCPPTGAVDDSQIKLLHENRTWRHISELLFDPVELAIQSETPIQHARTKIIGPTQADGLRSLATKIWMIENAQHTIDVVYYIFTRDEVGYAVLGALCNAVRRGVDVRIMVDSIGSMHPTHSELRALETCADDAGFMRNGEGEVTITRARVQVVIFSALSKISSWANRRSHDKLLVIDGHFPDRAIVMTGGRNISLAYYGIHADGSSDPTAYRDLEMILRPMTGESSESLTVGDVSEIYFSLLYLNKGNKRIWPADNPDTERRQREKAQQSLQFFKSQPDIQQKMSEMPEYLETGFHDSLVRLAHEMDNLTNVRVVTEVAENKSRNPSSITYLLSEITGVSSTETSRSNAESSKDILRIISPYLFIAKYYDNDGNLILDGAEEVHKWLREHPAGRLEIITNSVLTSDNIFAQSIIDMELGPRLLLSPELQQAWLSSLKEGELNQQLVESEEWKKQINHPQIFIYETGKLDSVKLGNGTEQYGKLHAKFITGGEYGFVGTSNFDYRSRLYNNEMGFFYENSGVSRDLVDVFEFLKSTSYRWGSPEWLQMRRQAMALKGMKSWSVRHQRGVYKFMKATGIDWLI